MRPVCLAVLQHLRAGNRHPHPAFPPGSPAHFLFCAFLPPGTISLGQRIHPQALLAGEGIPAERQQDSSGVQKSVSIAGKWLD